MDQETKQAVFEKAYRGLKAQGFERSVDEMSSRCLYRGPNGRKCAVGHLIPDDKYLPRFDEDALGGSVLAACGVDFSFETFKFFAYLQEAHDSGLTPERMQSNLAHFADSYGLTVPVD